MNLVRLPILLSVLAGFGAASPTPSDKEDIAPRKQLFAGKVVLVRDALAKRGIESAEELAGQVALQTHAGELLPIVPDWRGRAFFQDKRLRNRDVELIGFRQSGIPYVQVLSIYTFDEKGTRHYTDYWCDICAIPMYEIMQCQCCQGEIRLRFQPRELPQEFRSTTTMP